MILKKACGQPLFFGNFFFKKIAKTQPKKKLFKIAIFLHIVQASSQYIKGF